MISRLYTYFFLILAIGYSVWVGFDSSKFTLFIVIPFILLSLYYEKINPLSFRKLEANELRTDIISLLVVVALTFSQNYLVHLFIFEASNIVPASSILQLSPVVLHNLPFWLECIIAFLLYDFAFYIMHRIAHRQPFLWKLHAMHHSPGNVTYMNSNRIHPLDLIIRRSVPMFLVISLGVSEKAFIFVGVLINILGPVSHFNINLKHGLFNYLIGTNEVHVWHHSVLAQEAKNFGITMIWDHLFGTFYFPRDRRTPDRVGLADQKDYPMHQYHKELLLPFKQTRKFDNFQLDAKPE